jgi:aspartyl-tRNA(Asn)/glutamyl-tRNA(Gln) amidotransferase subunit C
MSGPTLDLEAARRIAWLARLELAEEELALFAGQLDAILRYVAQLEELELEGVEGTSHALALECPTRPDTIRPSWPREEILGRAPAQDGEHFLAPRMIGHE